jgi:hypothetical protein
MSNSDIMEGMVTDDGSLKLGRRIALPPGPVRVTLESMAAKANANVWAVLERIRLKRSEWGLAGRSRDEIDAQIRQLRDEWDQE